ncbi:SDR family oxidoreductase [Kutzneria sp. NPDC052558]|uniref:SDR family oxidoreductase n=1 Tax=Kutzneria sp. NPDC052558 TaxID=3364121 RepID=UPI0037C97034
MSYPKIDLDGAVVLITGGARGIGRATAELFARHGATVCVADLDGAADAARDLGGHPYTVDVSARSSYADCVSAVLDGFGRVDVLVNNAGVMPLGGFLDEPDATSRTTLDVNLWGLVNGMRLVLPHMIARRRGHVVTIASMAGKIPIPGMAVYNASKFAAVGLTAAVRAEYAHTGVSVSAVLPSAVRTRLSSGVPLGRGLPTVDPSAIARAVLGSVKSRRAEIPVPGYLAAWDLINAVTPEPLMRLGRRMIGDRRALTSVDPSVRAAYERTITAQAGSEPSGSA